MSTYRLEPVPGGETLVRLGGVVPHAKFYNHETATRVCELLNAKDDLVNLLHRLKIHNRTGPLADDVTAMLDKLEAL